LGGGGLITRGGDNGCFGLRARRPGSWDAHDFKFSEKAIAYAVEHHIPDVQIVMVFRESGHVETVPFPKQLAASSSRLPH
jgi:hypothetical protein